MDNSLLKLRYILSLSQSARAYSLIKISESEANLLETDNHCHLKHILISCARENNIWIIVSSDYKCITISRLFMEN